MRFTSIALGAPRVVMLLVAATVPPAAMAAEPSSRPAPATQSAARPAEAQPLTTFPGMSEAGGPAFSRDGTKLLTVGDTEVYVWDARTFEAVAGPLKASGRVSSASISANGARVAAAAGKEALVWDLATGKQLAALPHGDVVRCVAFSADGSRVATGGDDKAVRVWEASTGKAALADPLRHGQPVSFVAFTPDAERLITSDYFVERRDGRHRPLPPRSLGVYFWDAATGQPVRTPILSRAGGLQGCNLSADGRRLATNDWQIDVWDAQIRQHLQTIDDPELSNISHVVLSNDGSRVALGGVGYARVFSAATGKPMGPAMGTDTFDAVRWLRFSPDGARLLIAARVHRSGIDSPMTGVWDIATGVRMLPLPYSETTAGDFSPDGRRIAISFKDGETGATTLWDVPPEVPAAAIEAAKPRATIPGTLPARGDKDRLIPLQHLEVRNDIPHDLPLPAVTPFDDSPDGRRDYHRGYRLGFVVDLLDESPPDDLVDQSPAFQRGMKDGETDGYKLHALRAKSARAERFDYYKGSRAHQVTESSPEPEQTVLRRFNAFARDFERAIRRLYPDTVAIDVTGVPRLYHYEYDDYSRDNTRQPHPVQAYKGMFDSKRRGNLEWMVVRIKDPAHPGPNDEEIQGRYGFEFDYDEPAGKWNSRNPLSDGPDDGTFMHMQQTDLAGHAFKSRSSKLTYKWIREAIEQAQAKPEATQPSRKRDGPPARDRR